MIQLLQHIIDAIKKPFMTQPLQHIIDAIKARSPERVPKLLLEKQQERVIPLLDGKYTLRITPIAFEQSRRDLPGIGERKINLWSYTAVEILLTATKEKLGEYVRNYRGSYDTFFPFKKGNREFALYSKDYTATRIMSLPDCVDLAGEDGSAGGFCPTEYYVPQPEDAIPFDEKPNEALNGSFGFIAGCVWGDDTSWKIQYLDLSKIEEGILVREPRFGYLELPDRLSLREAINVANYEEGGHIRINTAITFSLKRSVDIDFSLLTYKIYEAQRDLENPSRNEKCIHCEHLGKVHWLNSDDVIQCMQCGVNVCGIKQREQ